MNKKLTVWMIGLFAMTLMALPVYAESGTQPLAIEAKFSGAYEFHEGLASVEVGNKRGVIDRTGQFVVEPRYDWIEDFKDGYAYVGQPEKGMNRIGLIDKTGKELIKPLYDPLDRMSNGFWKAAKDDKYDLFDKNGNLISDSQYDYIGDFHEGLALVHKKLSNNRIKRTVDGITTEYPDARAGYIDETGKLVIPLQYDVDSEEFESGLAVVAKDGKRGVIDKAGKTVIPFQYDHISRKIYARDAASGYMAVSKNRKYGVIDTKGKTVIPLKYDTASVTPDGVMIYGMMRKPIVQWSWAKEGRLIRDAKGNYHETDRGAMDIRTGKTIAPTGYDTIMYMHNGLLSVCKSNKCGLINRSGKVVLPVKYKYISDLPLSYGANFYIVHADGKLGIFNPSASNSGNIQLYDYNNMAPLGSFAEDPREGLFRALNKNKKVGVITDKGKEIVKAKYDEISDFHEGFAGVKLNGKYGFIDRTGKEIVAPQYAKVGAFHEGLAYVQKDGKYGFIDKSGKEVISPQFDDVRSGFYDGMATVRVNGKWGYIAKPQAQ